MSSGYNLKNIRILLTECFTDQEIRRFCREESAFRPVYDDVGPETGKVELIDRLIEYAERKLQLDLLLALVKESNAARYEKHQPYYQPAAPANGRSHKTVQTPGPGGLLPEPNSSSAHSPQVENVLAPASPGWQALVIDADTAWREITCTNISQLGGIPLDGQTISPLDHPDLVAECALAIVGVSPQTQAELSAQAWIRAIARANSPLPLILLASWNNRDTVVTLRNALRAGNMNSTITTIFKETFDLYWFSRIVHQILTR